MTCRYERTVMGRTLTTKYHRCKDNQPILETPTSGTQQESLEGGVVIKSSCSTRRSPWPRVRWTCAFFVVEDGDLAWRCE